MTPAPRPDLLKGPGLVLLSTSYRYCGGLWGYCRFHICTLDNIWILCGVVGSYIQHTAGEGPGEMHSHLWKWSVTLSAPVTLCNLQSARQKSVFCLQRIEMEPVT